MYPPELGRNIIQTGREGDFETVLRAVVRTTGVDRGALERARECDVHLHCHVSARGNAGHKDFVVGNRVSTELLGGAGDNAAQTDADDYDDQDSQRALQTHACLPCPVIRRRIFFLTSKTATIVFSYRRAIMAEVPTTRIADIIGL